MHRRTVVNLLLAATFTALFLATALLCKQPQQHRDAAHTPVAEEAAGLVNALRSTLASSVTAHYEIRVNNKTVAKGVDPVTKHWLNAALGTILGDQIAWWTPDGQKHTMPLPITWTDWNGNQHTGDDDFEVNGGNPSLQICYKSAQTPITYTSSTIPDATCIDITDYTYTETADTIVIAVTTSTNILQNTTIYAIGIRYKHNIAVLIAAEEVIVTVPANSTLTITYTFTIKKQPPFTNNAYHIIAGYLLAARRYGYSASTSIYDTGGQSISFDSGIDDCGYHDRTPDESHLIGTNSDFDIGAYSVTNSFKHYMSAAEVTSATTTINDTNCELLIVSASYSQLSQATVSSIAIYRHVDGDSYCGRRDVDVLVAIVPLGVSLTTDSLGVTFGVGLCGSQ